MIRVSLAAALCAAIACPAEAQTASAPPSSGVEQSAIVPHGEAHDASKSGTMTRDCTRTPDACNEAPGGRNASRPGEPKVPN